MYSDFIKISTRTNDLVDITEEVEKIVRKSGVKRGLCLVFNSGSTGAIMINEYEERLLEDFRELFEKLSSGKHRHPSNAHSHLKAGLIGPGKTISIKDGKMELGTWQSIIFCEFDTCPRERSILVRIIGDNS